MLAEIGALDDATVYLHGAVDTGVQVYRQAGVAMVPTCPVLALERQHDLAGCLVIAPPSAGGSSWSRRFKHVQQGFASGWMRVRGNRRRRNVDRGFVLSDHADWPDLLRTVRQTGATRVIATHGNIDALVRWLRERGVQAGGFATAWGDEAGQ